MATGVPAPAARRAATHGRENGWRSSVGINGFGRIGRLVVRAARRARHVRHRVRGGQRHHRRARPWRTCCKYDSVHGVWAEPAAADGDTLRSPASDIRRCSSEKDPAKLPWKELGVDVVLECTGKFTDRETAQAHLAAGRATWSASRRRPRAPTCTFVIGVNDAALRQGEAPGRVASARARPTAWRRSPRC